MTVFWDNPIPKSRDNRTPLAILLDPLCNGWDVWYIFRNVLGFVSRVSVNGAVRLWINFSLALLFPHEAILTDTLFSLLFDQILCLHLLPYTKWSKHLEQSFLLLYVSSNPYNPKTYWVPFLGIFSSFSLHNESSDSVPGVVTWKSLESWAYKFLQNLEDTPV